MNHNAHSCLLAETGGGDDGDKRSYTQRISPLGRQNFQRGSEDEFEPFSMLIDNGDTLSRNISNDQPHSRHPLGRNRIGLVDDEACDCCKRQSNDQEYTCFTHRTSLNLYL